MAANPAPAGIEAKPAQLGEKLLERALEDQESARKSLVREMKVGFLILLLIQLWMLPRFVSFSDAIDTNNKKIASLKAQDSALRELRRNLESLRLAVRRGAEELAKRLYELPRALHGQTERLDDEIKNLKAERGENSHRVQTQATQSSDTGFLSYLTPAERMQIASAPDPVRHTLIAPVVRSRIIDPAFANLNSQLSSELKQPYAAAKHRIEGLLKTHEEVLRPIGIDVGSIRSELNAGQERLEKLAFVVPASDSWWASVRGKEETTGEQNVNTQKVADELRRQLTELKNQTAPAESRVAALLQSTQQDQAALQTRMKELDEQLRAMEDTLADEAKPFKFLAIQLRDAVVYFPVVVAALSGYLAFEYLVLLLKVRRLWHAYHQLGYRSETLRLYFAGVPGTTVSSGIAITVLFAVPVVMCFWSDASHSV